MTGLRILGKIAAATTRKMRLNVRWLIAGLALRLFLVLKFPVTDSGDAPFYIELAWNWLKNGVYGVAGQRPADARWICAFRAIPRSWRRFSPSPETRRER